VKISHVILVVAGSLDPQNPGQVRLGVGQRVLYESRTTRARVRQYLVMFLYDHYDSDKALRRSVAYISYFYLLTCANEAEGAAASLS